MRRGPKILKPATTSFFSLDAHPSSALFYPQLNVGWFIASRHIFDWYYVGTDWIFQARRLCRNPIGALRHAQGERIST